MLALLKLVALVVSLFQLLGPWGSLVLVAVLGFMLVGLYHYGEHLMDWFIHSQARSIGKVLEGATLTVHAVTSAPEPDPSVWRTGDDEEDDAFEEDLEASDLPEGDYAWFQIDATIEPRPAADGSTPGWEPAMIHLRKADGRTRHALEIDIDCLVAQVELWQVDRFVPFEHGKVEGTARLKFYAGVTPGTQNVRFSYLGAEFGELRLPATSRVPA